MNNLIVVGAQWGDEGKGKFVDIYSANADVVVRWGGGANAGHTLVVNDQKLITHLVPSGVIYPNKYYVLGHNMVICPVTLLEEINQLKKLGLLERDDELLKISSLAHIVMPYCIALDELREAATNNDIGTTKRGIGPAYELKARRTGIRMGDLLYPESFSKLVKKALTVVNPEIIRLGGIEIKEKDMVDFLQKTRNDLLPYITNVSKFVFEAIEKNKKILFEGAQGAALDIDHGTYPYVTSSSTLSGAASSGSGVGPTNLNETIGIAKAYVTRVGGGPFPTKLTDDVGEQIRKVGAEFGATTKRPRDTGWMDLVQLRYGARINGLTGLAITKLDVLRGIHPIKICYAYIYKDKLYEDWGDISPSVMGLVTSLYRELPGFDEDITGARKLEDLPSGAREIVNAICGHVGVPIKAVSVGPDREQTILLDNKF